MRDEWIGGQRQPFVVKVEREQVAREGATDRRGDRQCEEPVESRLVLLAMGAHIPDGIEDRENPEKCDDERETHPQGFGSERDRHARQDFEQGD